MINCFQCLTIMIKAQRQDNYFVMSISRDYTTEETEQPLTQDFLVRQTGSLWPFIQNSVLFCTSQHSCVQDLLRVIWPSANSLSLQVSFISPFSVLTVWSIGVNTAVWWSFISFSLVFFSRLKIEMIQWELLSVLKQEYDLQYTLFKRVNIVSKTRFNVYSR